MKHILWLLRWILKIAIFFTLFAFALNNQQVATVHFFFGNYWLAPMVLVVLCAFAIGVVVGVLGMTPWWWRHRQARQDPVASQANTEPTAPGTPPVYADGI
ncbi:MAG: LapA family protein [Rhodoferax sp.]|jgi:putative membrane protein|nr:LapA family protein [Rhodoferax sp.]